MSYAFELLQVLNNDAIRELTIFASKNDFVQLGLKFESLVKKVNIFYIYKEEDTLLGVTRYNKRLVEDKNYIDVAREDLFHFLTNARFGEDIEICIRYNHHNEETVGIANCVYEQFKNHSQTTKNPIYARSLHLQFENVSQLHSILTSFNPTSIKELRIFNFKRVKKILDFGSIVEMDHWKNAKIISLYGFFVNIPFENFSHCEDVTLKVKRISADDIQTLVNICSISPSSRHFHIDYSCLNKHVTEQFLDKLYGEQQINKSGKLVRLIENKIEFVHESFCKSIYIYKISDKNDVSMETSKVLTSLPSKSAMLCLSNRLIMEKIVRHFDFAELVVLRRVSRGSRRCVDFLKPDPKLVAMNITMKTAYIIVDVFGRYNNTSILYKYPGTRVATSFLKIDHKADINNLSDDLVQLLKNQKTALKELCATLKPLNERNYYNTTKMEDWQLSVDQFIGMFQATFSSRDNMLAVEKLNLTTTCLTRTTQILENLDPVAIKTIALRTMSFLEACLQSVDVSRSVLPYSNSTKLNKFSVPDVQSINDLASLEQWRNANELEIENCVVECDIEKLVHFSKVDIRLRSISSEDVLYLKEVS
ncbi:F-box domain-containing protein [Caenorhabditis elegans]|uniref:F-box domain-containing protein n=1 Tax=Caenorhabditis elegans TaxID=6239 RepID=Q9N4L1_CAEEL|nr:F-box domain-containing protein [Caenorhabditis elegans]CCD64690.1 F-box domain-containing protein [Caenorhabditis elegans]|eukprot:NP_494091.1 Uncharacterized protein CELE_C52E2.5 [Caenorhabditis elegans]